MSIVDDSHQCEVNAETHLRRAAQCASPTAKAAHLNLAAIYAAQCERLRMEQAQALDQDMSKKMIV